MYNELIRRSTQADVEYLGQNLRDADAQECEALGFPPDVGVSLSYHMSSIRYTLVDPKTGNPGAMLGVAPADPISGKVWLLGTPAIEKNSITFLRGSKPTLDRLYKESERDILTNYVHAKNELHIKWLKWLGFTFMPKVELVPGHEFYPFARIRK